MPIRARNLYSLCGEREVAEVIINQLSHAAVNKAVEIDCYWSERVNVKLSVLVSTFIDALNLLLANPKQQVNIYHGE